MRAWSVGVVITPWEEGGYLAEVPALQGCWVVGQTAEEALRDIHEVIELSISSRLRHGDPIPVELEELQQLAGSPFVVRTAVALP